MGYHYGDYMTIDNCTTHCKDNGYAYAGIDSAKNCECGNTLPPAWRLLSNSRCNKVSKTNQQNDNVKDSQTCAL